MWQLRKYGVVIAAIAVGTIAAVVSAAGGQSGGSFLNFHNLRARKQATDHPRSHCGDELCEDVYEYCKGELADTACKEGDDCKKWQDYCTVTFNTCQNRTDIFWNKCLLDNEAAGGPKK